jgi:hypothetical protein
MIPFLIPSRKFPLILSLKQGIRINQLPVLVATVDSGALGGILKSPDYHSKQKKLTLMSLKSTIMPLLKL